jgi:N-acetylglutamate synthase-like GNAT family acetyltransferase
MSSPSRTEDFHIEVIPGLTPSTPRAGELAELYLTSMGNLQDRDPDLIADEIESMKGATFVTLMDDDERVVAMGGLIQPLGSTEGIVTNVATSPEHREKGLASKVVDELVRLAMREDLTLLSVSPTPSSDEFYAQRGFDETKSAMWRTKKL